jgi:hypothetical protein
MALSKDRNTLSRDGKRFSDPVAATTVIYAGALVQLNSAGNAVPASATAANVPRGVAVEKVDNSAGAAGDLRVESLRGVFCFKNSAAADEITRAEIGDTCYVVDDETVAKTNNAGARPAAGVVRDVDAKGVWVEI